MNTNEEILNANTLSTDLGVCTDVDMSTVGNQSADISTLAKEILKVNFGLQETFILGKLEERLLQPAEAGDVLFVYKGPIYPQVREELEENGFSVMPLKPATAITYFGSPLVNLISIGDIRLSDEELAESRKRAKKARELNRNGPSKVAKAKDHVDKSFPSTDVSSSDVSENYYSDLVAELKSIHNNSSVGANAAVSYGNSYAIEDTSNNTYNARKSTPATSVSSNTEKRIQAAQRRQKRGRKH